MPDFNDQKKKMQKKMQQSFQQDDASENLEEAAESMHRTAMSQMQQNQEMSQAFVQTQQQIQSLSNSVRQMTTQMQMQNQQQQMQASSAPMPPPDMTASMGGPAEEVASAGGGMGQKVKEFGGAAKSTIAAGASAAGAAGMEAAQMAAASAQQTVQQVQRGVSRQGNVVKQGTGAPGVIQAGNYGAKKSMINAMAPNWNPASAQRYTAGAYQKAFSRHSGVRGQDVASGARRMGMDLATPSSVAAGAAMYAAPGLGSLAAPAIKKVTSPLDAASPANYANEQLGHVRFFGEQAQRGSSQFLRGRGEPTEAAGQLGQFSIEEQGEIGRGLREMNVKDFTMSGSDIGELQTMMGDSGMMEGVQTSEEYVRHMKKQVQTAKRVMKNFQVGKKQATKFMEQMYNQMGQNPGQEMLGMQSNVKTATHLSGGTMGENVQAAVRGANQASQNNLMPGIGAQTALESKSLGGIASTRMARQGKSGLVSAVGGEQGLAEISQRTDQQFLKGGGGTMLALGGQYDDIGQGLSQAAAGMQDGGIVGFAANKHKRISEAAEDLGPHGAKMQKFGQVMDVAKKMKGVGGSKRERMNLVAQNMFKMSSQKAEAFVDQAVSMPETLERRRRAQGKEVSNQLEDITKERFSPRGRAQNVYRGAMEGMVGDAIGSISRAEDYVGETVRSKTQDLSDEFYGIEREYTAESTAKQIRGASRKELGDVLQTGTEGASMGDVTGSGGELSMGVGEYENMMKKSNAQMTDTIEELKTKISSTKSKSKKRKLIKAGTEALESGREYDSVENIMKEWGGMGPAGDLSSREKKAAQAMGVASDDLMKAQGEEVNMSSSEGLGSALKGGKGVVQGFGDAKEAMTGGIAGEVLGQIGGPVVEGAAAGLALAGATGEAELKEGYTDTQEAKLTATQEVFGMDPRDEDERDKAQSILASDKVQKLMSKAKKGARLEAQGKTLGAKKLGREAKSMLEKLSGKERSKVRKALKRSGMAVGDKRIQFAGMGDEGLEEAGISGGQEEERAMEKFMTGEISAKELEGKIGQKLSKDVESTLREGVLAADKETMQTIEDVETKDEIMDSAIQMAEIASEGEGGVLSEASGLSTALKKGREEGDFSSVGRSIVQAYKSDDVSGKDIENAKAPVRQVIKEIKKGKLSSSNMGEIGERLTQLMGQGGVTGGEQVDASEGNVKRALDSDLAGTESVKGMIENMQLQNAALQEIKNKLEDL